MVDRLCERCSYDEASADAKVPDYFQDRYLEICEHCARELNVIQFKLSDWGEH